MPRNSNEDRILGEHPALRAMLERIPHTTRVLSVARGDAALMWRDGDVNAVYQEELPPRRVMVRNETLYVMDSSGIRFSFSSWPERGATYVRDLISDRPSTPSALVWMVRRDYYAATKTPYEPGAFLTRELNLTVYKPPAQGWIALAKNPSLDDVPLTIGILMRGYMNRAEWRHLAGRLGDLSKRLEYGVYDNGLRAIIDGTKLRGTTGKLGDITLLTYVIAGRVNLQLERDNVLLNSLGCEGESRGRFGPHGMRGTYRQIEKLVDDFVSQWAALSPVERHEIVKPTTEAGFAF